MTPLSMVSWTLLAMALARTWPKLDPRTVDAQMGYGPHQARWLAQHHLTEWIAYQPHSHLLWLALARNGLLVAVAVFLVLASVWWLRQHPAE